MGSSDCFPRELSSAHEEWTVLCPFRRCSVTLNSTTSCAKSSFQFRFVPSAVNAYSHCQQHSTVASSVSSTLYAAFDTVVQRERYKSILFYILDQYFVWIYCDYPFGGANIILSLHEDTHYKKISLFLLKKLFGLRNLLCSLRAAYTNKNVSLTKNCSVLCKFVTERTVPVYLNRNVLLKN